MSNRYVEKDNETTLTIFNKRVLYDFDSQNEDYKNLVDFNIGEKFFYGRVSRTFEPLYVINSPTLLKTANFSSSQSEPRQAMKFVVDMFERLKTQFDKNIADGKLSGNDPFLSSLKIYKGYQDPTELHTCRS